jgi:hypothetical protein
VRVTFERPADHQRGFALVERDDGVSYRMDGGPVTAAVPHDLVHFPVERTLGMADGIWGSIAAGVVFRSMHHHGGRRPPHAAERSAALIRAHRDRLHRAELLGGFVERAAAAPDPSPAGIAPLARVYLSKLPAADMDLDRLAAAARALHEMAARWRAVPVGGSLVVEWPARLRLPAAPPARRQPRGAAARQPRRAGRAAARR